MSGEQRVITELDDRILEAFDGQAGMRDGLLAVYNLGRGTAADVRALPDRETIARAIFETGTTDLDWDLVDGEERKWYLAVADAVLALFGQEGQR